MGIVEVSVHVGLGLGGVCGIMIEMINCGGMYNVCGPKELWFLVEELFWVRVLEGF